jgi:hypothetical protein
MRSSNMWPPRDRFASFGTCRKKIPFARSQSATTMCSSVSLGVYAAIFSTPVA